MKDKILTALKTKYKTLGFGEKAFDGVADFLSKTVTEEKDIETAIGGVESLLKAFQGDADKRVTTLKSELDELKKKPKDPEPPKPTDDDPKPDDIQKIIQKAIEPLQQKLEGYEKRETREKLQTKVLSSVREGFKNEKEKKSFDAWMKGRTVEVDDENKLDETVENLKTGFSEFRQEMIDQGVITEIPPDSGGESDQSTIDGYLDEKFPKSNNEK